MTENRRSELKEMELRERIKELTCLYKISELSRQPDISLKKIIQGVVELLPPAWRYPEKTCAKIVFDGISYASPNFHQSGNRLSASITVAGETRGRVEVVYSDGDSDLKKSVFLKEERNLIDTVAVQIALIIERKEAEKEKAKLNEQLRHADRLATIGTLASGVAHEINEPLANILGFAQLVKKCPDLPEVAKDDVEKIEKASLRAREIVKKLLFFARQEPPKKTAVNLNKIVEDGLYLYRGLCERRDIELVSCLCEQAPELIADPAQLHQVLVNLVVNAIDAIPQQGKITVKTSLKDDHALLSVEDTGAGMKEDVLKQIFVPFFTTKDVGHGTGLGLPVVYGIVTAHNGSIDVESEPGGGTKFEIRIPTGKQGDWEDKH